MRTLKELIPFVAESVSNNDDFLCLCTTTINLCKDGIIDNYECVTLIDEYNSLAKKLGIYRKGLWWDIRIRTPRLEFLKELLKLQE